MLAAMLAGAVTSVSASPTPIPGNVDESVNVVAAPTSLNFIIAVSVIIAALVTIGWAMVAAGRFPMLNLVSVIVGIVAVVCILGAALPETDDPTASMLGAIAATAVGALAATLVSAVDGKASSERAKYIFGTEQIVPDDSDKKVGDDEQPQSGT